MTNGTPKTILAAIQNGLAEPRIDEETTDHFIELHVRDFLAQRFTLAYAKATSPAEIERLETLFASLVRKAA